MASTQDMSNQDLYDKLLAQLSDKLVSLEDKPEETPEATLKALWFYVSGNPKSAQLASTGPLPGLDLNQIDQLHKLCEARLRGTPLAHITGRQQFLGIELIAGPEALIPRKETELLGRTALNIISDILKKQTHVTIIDVCTGAGNLPIAYARNYQTAMVHAADLSQEAVSLAQRNVDFHQLGDQVHLKVGNLLEPFDNTEFHHAVDLITCNPPYISTAKVSSMHAEISQHEPQLAFDGGAFGIKILNALVQQAPVYLKKGGWLAFEVGLGQGPSMMKLVKKSGKYDKVLSVEDQNGQIRVIMATV